MAQEKSKLEKYAEIQNLVQKEARVISLQVYREQAAKYGVAEVPLHKHNGFDSPRISEDDVVITNKLNTQLLGTNDTGAPSSETIILRNVKNVSRISFHGFGANNALAPATLRCTTTGEIIFGICNVFTGVSPTIVVTTNPPGTPFVQACNTVYLDSTSAANTRVGTTPRLAAVISPAGEICYLNLDSYDNNSLTFTMVLDTDWTLQGNIIIE